MRQLYCGILGLSVAVAFFNLFIFYKKGWHTIMNIGFIGAGKVGFSLGKYFSLNSINITGYYSKNIESAKLAAQFTNSKPYTNLKDLIKDSDILILAVPDKVIGEVWVDMKSLCIKDKIICHTSGSISSDVFSDIDSLGAFGYSIHPMYAFSNKYTSYKELKGSYFSIEGNAKFLNTIEIILQNCNLNTFTIDKKDKALYHAANVTASNLVLGIIKISCDYLKTCGLNQEESLKALSPLIINNINNLINSGFQDALTGPIERNDWCTVLKHIESIPKADIELYKRLSISLLEIAREKNSNIDYTNLSNILGGDN